MSSEVANDRGRNRQIEERAMSATILKTRQFAEKVKDLDDSREGREELDRFIYFEESLNGILGKLNEIVVSWELLEHDLEYPFEHSKLFGTSGIQRKIKTKQTNFNTDPAQSVRSTFRREDFYSVLDLSRSKLLAKWKAKFESILDSAKQKIQHLQVIPQPGQQTNLISLEREVGRLQNHSEKLPSNIDEVEEAKELVKEIEELIGQLGQGGEISPEQRDQYEFLEESKIGMPGYSLRKLLEKESLREWLYEQDFLADYRIKKTR